MGICYTQQQQWNTHQQNYRSRRKNRKKNNYHSIIYEEKTIHQSFTQVQNSFRQDLHDQLNHIASDFGSITFGSIAQMSQSQLSTLQSSLEKINQEGQSFNPNQPITLCNLKTKIFLHTHKIKHPCSKKYNEVSACPYNSNHIVQYDLWKIIPITTTNNHVYIYHPLTQNFLTIFQNHLVCGTDKKQWKIKDFGRRRNGGFIQIYCEDDSNQQEKQERTDEEQKVGSEKNAKILKVSMTDVGGMLPNHRKLQLTSQNRIGNIWEIRFGQAQLQ